MIPIIACIFLLFLSTLTIYTVSGNLCTSPNFDAITRTKDGSTYVFKDKHYWRLGAKGLENGYPKAIKTDWPGLPDKLNAAVTVLDGKTYFFKGDKYWKFENQDPQGGYPRMIAEGFQGIPDDIDAVLEWSGNSGTYFFKGDKYWMFDFLKPEKPVSDVYPRNISLWNGLPNNLNAAFQWENKQSYFFKGSQYYGFDDRNFRVRQSEEKPYPRETADSWFFCEIETTSAKLEMTTLTSLFKPYNQNGDSNSLSLTTKSLFEVELEIKSTTEIFSPKTSNREIPGEIYAKTLFSKEIVTSTATSAIESNRLDSKANAQRSDRENNADLTRNNIMLNLILGFLMFLITN